MFLLFLRSRRWGYAPVQSRFEKSVDPFILKESLMCSQGCEGDYKNLGEIWFGLVLFSSTSRPEPCLWPPLLVVHTVNMARLRSIFIHLPAKHPLLSPHYSWVDKNNLCGFTLILFLSPFLPETSVSLYSSSRSGSFWRVGLSIKYPSLTLL